MATADLATGPAPARPRRAVLLLLGKALLVLAACYGVAVLCGMPMAVPFDVAVNAGGAPRDDALRAPADGKRRLVVLQHGLWRSAFSLWRLERTLRAHGYAVLNAGYPSTSGTVAEHAQRLHAAIERDVAAHGRPDEIAFVGHSLGGLVIAEYLRRPDARPAAAVVYVAAPLRGAMLTDLRKHWWLFPLLMGTKAALELSPGDPQAQKPVPAPGRAGAIVGNLGDGNPDIPGDDDGTVAVAEARLPGAVDTVELPLGHTRIAADPATARQVLAFLRTGRFAH